MEDVLHVFCGLQSNKEREDHSSSFSKSRISFYFVQADRVSAHKQLTHAPKIIQCNAGRKEHLSPSHPNRFARRQNQQHARFPCPQKLVSAATVFSTAIKSIKSWKVSNKGMIFLNFFSLNRVNRIFKQDLIILQEKWGDRHDNSRP